MKIEAVVISEELPRGCGYCRFEGWDGVNETAKCLLTEKNMTYHCMPRPDWCPLIALAENEKIVIHSFEGQGHIEPNRESEE